MIYRLLTISALLSLLMCIVAIGLCLCGYCYWSRDYYWRIASSSNRLYVLTLSRNAVHLNRFPNPRQPQFAEVQQSCRFFGGRWHRSIIWSAGEDIDPEPTWHFVLYYWFLGLVAAILPIIWLIVWWRRRRLPTLGCCQECGYNLRGNVSGICPECGYATKTCEGDVNEGRLGGRLGSERI